MTMAKKDDDDFLKDGERRRVSMLMLDGMDPLRRAIAEENQRTGRDRLMRIDADADYADGARLAGEHEKQQAYDEIFARDADAWRQPVSRDAEGTTANRRREPQLDAAPAAPARTGDVVADAALDAAMAIVDVRERAYAVAAWE